MTTTFSRTDRRHGAASQNGAAQTSAALLELAKQLIDAPDDDEACRRLAAGLKEIGDVETVAVGLTPHGGRSRLRAVSGLTKIDRNAADVRIWEQSLSSADDTDGTHERPWIVPLRSRTGRVFGACAIVARSADATTSRSLLQTSMEIIGPLMEVAIAARKRWQLGAPLRAIARVLTDRRRTVAVVAMIVGAMFVPLPLSVRCDCELQPQVRRTVAAPFQAVWRKSYVRPGDFVAVGQSLGLLDASELQRELTAATAERDRAAKSSDVNAAAGKTAAAQIDRLEVRRIDERRSLIAARLANVEVKSPLAGIVVSGEWDRAEGAPIKQGTVLFEIAPLDRIVVEALVPEGDLDRVQTGSTTNVVLEARPYETRIGNVGRIYPQAQIRDDANVFIAEIVLENTDGVLRPGMKGRVNVETETRSIARLIADRAWPTCSRLRW